MALPDETARDGSSETTAPPAVQAFDGSEPCASVGPAACDAGDIRCQTADSESETTRFAVAGEDPDDSASDDLRLIPGAFVGDGRYRLLLWHGGLEHLQFWQALDTTLHRQVALTLVDPDGRLPDEQIQAIVSRTLSLSRLDMPGIGRVLQVVRAAPGAIVVAEWIRGATLAEVADTNPPPVGAARAMQSLAAAAEAAHRGGTALSIDHPSRVRVSIEGHVALAFPATMPDATREADLRGIGACLYALLVDRWPLPQSGAPSALAPAQVETEVRPKDPTAIDADIPFQISAVATGSSRACGEIRAGRRDHAGEGRRRS